MKDNFKARVAMFLHAIRSCPSGKLRKRMIETSKTVATDPQHPDSEIQKEVLKKLEENE